MPMPMFAITVTDSMTTLAISVLGATWPWRSLEYYIVPRVLHCPQDGGVHNAHKAKIQAYAYSGDQS